ncbi:MAG: hypothetical protein JSS86_19035 [Cyanobacteria bacterium SZAS LIN-2]|nr:hypothetical protein [Cyanobacteria bacterium SZAS LIN-2]
MSSNTGWRLAVGIVGLCFVLAAANYYGGLGWFGRRDKLVMSALMLLTLIVLSIAIKRWQPQGFRDR